MKIFIKKKNVLPWAIHGNQFIVSIFIGVWKKMLLNHPNKTPRICCRLIHDDFATIIKRSRNYRPSEGMHLLHASSSAYEFELESDVFMVSYLLNS